MKTSNFVLLILSFFFILTLFQYPENYNNKKEIENLIINLGHEDYTISNKAYNTLKKLNPEVIKPLLLKELNNKDKEIRQSIIRLAGDLRINEATDILLRMPEEKDEFVFRELVETLTKLRSKQQLIFMEGYLRWNIRK